MNYLTSILSSPLFTIIFFFEVWLVWAHPRIQNDLNRRITYSYLAVSFLQMVSSNFWFFGFVFSKLNSIYSEGLDPGEVCDCVGLVGAEVILAIFQWIMTCSTAWQVLSFLQISDSKVPSSRLGGRPLIAFYTFCLLLWIYVCICWLTAYNRRCPQVKPIAPELQHIFYPVFLVIDMVLYTMTARKLQIVQRKLEETIATTSKYTNITTKSAGPGEHQNSRVVSVKGDQGDAERNQAAMAKLRETVFIYRLAYMMTIVTGVTGCIIFYVQFVVRVPQFSLIACIYCFLMYCCYASRRTPFMMIFTGFRTFQGQLASQSHGNLASPIRARDALPSVTAL